MTVNGEVKLRLGDKISVKIFEINRQTRSITAIPAQSIGGLLLPDPKNLANKDSRR